MVPPPGIVGSHICIKGIIAIAYKEFCRFQSFLGITAFFLKILSGKGTLSPVFYHAFYAVAQDDRKIFSAAGFDLFHHFSGKTETVLQGTAVLIGSLIEHGDGKLIQQVSLMDCMYLNTVKSAAFGIVSAVTERFYDAADLLFCQGTAGLIKPPVRNGRRRYRRKFSQVGWNGNTSETTGHHKKDLTSVCMDPLCHLSAGTDKMHRIIGGIRTVWHTLCLHLAV